jgi:CRP-like cAMP-binding protein
MTQIAQSGAHNILLKHMLPGDFDLLRPYFERVSHCSGDTVARPGDDIGHVSFPEGAVTAHLIVKKDGTRMAVGLVGHEGLIGFPLLLGEAVWHYEVAVRAANSTALRIRADRLLDACRQSPNLHALLLRFASTFVLQVGRTSVVNLVEPLERRMARWILLYHDRLHSDEIVMTHEEISIMLGVRRASATDILHILEGEHAVRSVRGRIIIRDRLRLEEIAGECYGDAEQGYRKLIGPFGKTPERVQPSRPVQATD